MNVFAIVLAILGICGTIGFFVLWYGTIKDLDAALADRNMLMETQNNTQRSLDAANNENAGLIGRIKAGMSEYEKSGWDALAHLAENATKDDTRLAAASLLIHRESPVTPASHNPLWNTHG